MAGPAALQCTLALESLQPATLHFVLHNTARHGVDVLTWGTPFEGWFHPFVRVTRDGVELRYQGPTLKRGDPDREDYLRFMAGQSRGASIALQPAYDVGAPGRYRVEPRIVLHDAARSAGARVSARPRSQHQAAALDCAALEFELR